MPLPTTIQRINLSMATIEQNNSALWHAHRKGRTTVSMIHKINVKSLRQSALNLIMTSNPSLVLVVKMAYK